MVYAEKIVTALQRGTGNTRWRDFADVYGLCRRHPVSGDELRHSVVIIAAHRRIELAPLHIALAAYPATAQSAWAVWRRRQRLDDRLPLEFTTVLNMVIQFADPVLTGEAIGRTWHPGGLTWT